MRCFLLPCSSCHVSKPPMSLWSSFNLRTCWLTIRLLFCCLRVQPQIHLIKMLCTWSGKMLISDVIMLVNC